MPEARWLLRATTAQIKTLRATPETIDDLSDKHHYVTYVPATISFFTTGKVAMCAALAGLETIECDTVVDGELGIVKPAQIAKLLATLATVDLPSIARQVDAAKPKQLAKRVDDFDILLGADSPPSKLVVTEIEGLIAFYTRVAKGKTGVVMYTS
jgi:hypothetical protein